MRRGCGDAQPYAQGIQPLVTDGPAGGVREITGTSSPINLGKLPIILDESLQYTFNSSMQIERYQLKVTCLKPSSPKLMIELFSVHFVQCWLWNFHGQTPSLKGICPHHLESYKKGEHGHK